MGFSSKFKKHIDLETFDAKKAAEKLAPTGGLPIRPGEYAMSVEECEDKASAKGGEYRRMVFNIEGPTQVGRKIYAIFVFDCGNDSVEQRAIEQIMAIWVACGGKEDVAPDAEDMVGKTFIGITSVEYDDYKDGAYKPLVAGVEFDRKKKAEGEFGDDKLPQIWHDAVDFYANGGGKKRPNGGPKSKSFDDSDVPF